MEIFRILVADDDEDDRLLLEAAFSERGLKEKIEFVRDGLELVGYLERIRERDAMDEHFPRFILLDLNMPKKDGKEVLRFLKEHPVYRKIPVIVFTTTKNDQDIRQCYELGANTYVVKPASFDALLSVIEGIRTYWFNVASVSY